MSLPPARLPLKPRKLKLLCIMRGNNSYSQNNNRPFFFSFIFFSPLGFVAHFPVAPARSPPGSIAYHNANNSQNSTIYPFFFQPLFFSLVVLSFPLFSNLFFPLFQTFLHFSSSACAGLSCQYLAQTAIRSTKHHEPRVYPAIAPGCARRAPAKAAMTTDHRKDSNVGCSEIGRRRLLSLSLSLSRSLALSFSRSRFRLSKVGSCIYTFQLLFGL